MHVIAYEFSFLPYLLFSPHSRITSKWHPGKCSCLTVEYLFNKVFLRIGWNRVNFWPQDMKINAFTLNSGSVTSWKVTELSLPRQVQPTSTPRRKKKPLQYVRQSSLWVFPMLHSSAAVRRGCSYFGFGQANLNKRVLICFPRRSSSFERVIMRCYGSRWQVFYEPQRNSFTECFRWITW